MIQGANVNGFVSSATGAISKVFFYGADIRGKGLLFWYYLQWLLLVNCVPDVEWPEEPRGAAGAPCRSTSATGAAQKPAVVMVSCQVCR